GHRAAGVAARGPRPPAPGQANGLAPRRPVRPGAAEPALAAGGVEHPARPTGDAAALAPGARPAQVGRLRPAPRIRTPAAAGRRARADRAAGRGESDVGLPA